MALDLIRVAARDEEIMEVLERGEGIFERPGFGSDSLVPVSRLGGTERRRRASRPARVVPAARLRGVLAGRAEGP
jgi:hypothetical protein